MIGHLHRFAAWPLPYRNRRPGLSCLLQLIPQHTADQLSGSGMGKFGRELHIVDLEERIQPCGDHGLEFLFQSFGFEIRGWIEVGV